MSSDSESSSGSGSDEETVPPENVEKKPSDESEEEAGPKVWHKDDLVNLILEVRKQCPPDIIPFDVVDIDWEKVKCGFPVKKCQKKWDTLVHAVRHYRTLEEVTLDLLTFAKAPQFTAGNKLIKIKRAKVSEEIKDKPAKPRGKAKTNPDYPTKPRNGYSIFTSEILGQRKKGQKQKSFLEVSEIWKNMSAEEKKKYNDKAEMSRELYLSQLEEYALNHPDDVTIQDMLQSHKKSMERRKSEKEKMNKTPSIKNFMKKPQENHVELDETELNSSMDQEVSVLESPSKKRKHSESLTSTPSKSPKKKKKEKKWTGERVFVDKKREEYREEHPDLEESVLEAKLERKYARLSEAKQAKYEKLAAERNQLT